MSHREAPKRRVNPSGKVVWIARYTDSRGRRRIAKPAWNRGSGTFRLRRDAQRAIDEAYALPEEHDTVRGFLPVWLRNSDRTERTDDTNRDRINSVLDVEIEGREFGDFPLNEIRRRHVKALTSHMLLVHGRAATGAAGVLRSLSTFMEDAIDEDLADANPFRGARVRRDDKRALKKSRPPQVFTFAEMREFAACGRPEVREATRRPKKNPDDPDETPRFYSARNFEPMILTIALSGMRLGEVLALRTSQIGDGEFRPSGTAYKGRIVEGNTDEKTHVRRIPCPASLEFIIASWLAEDDRPDTDVLFPTGAGNVWHSGSFYRDVWTPARIASGMSIRPHDCRHSWVTHLRAAGVDDADLAEVAGHGVGTMLSTYTHSTGRSDAKIRELLG